MVNKNLETIFAPGLSIFTATIRVHIGDCALAEIVAIECEIAF